MRRVFLIAALVSSLAGCFGDDGVYSPSEPEQFSSRMFDMDRLRDYPLEERAYVMGHAIAIYLYGKTLPPEVEGTGFPYLPGVSAEDARVGYRYRDIMLAVSGGTDGRGTGILHDDVGLPPPDPTDPGDGGDPGPCESNDDAVDSECDPVDPDDPTGDPQDPWVDGDCETFLDPAAIAARELLPRVDVAKVLGGAFEGRDFGVYAAEFQRGMREALNLEDLDENTRYSEVEHLKDHVQAYGMCDHSPLVLDLAGDGIDASTPEEGVRFDLFGVGGGASVRTAWVGGDDALLALDRDGNGWIDSGLELFGNSRDARDGFQALAALDANGDGVIDAADPTFASLLLWRDANGDGVSDLGELAPLSAERIVSLPLDHVAGDARDAGGNAHRQLGRFVRAGGGEGKMIDVWFRVQR